MLDSKNYSKKLRGGVYFLRFSSPVMCKGVNPEQIQAKGGNQHEVKTQSVNQCYR